MASDSPGFRFVPSTGSTITAASAGNERVKKSGTERNVEKRMVLPLATYGPVPTQRAKNERSAKTPWDSARFGQFQPTWTPSTHLHTVISIPQCRYPRVPITPEAMSPRHAHYPTHGPIGRTLRRRDGRWRTARPEGRLGYETKARGRLGRARRPGEHRAAPESREGARS